MRNMLFVLLLSLCSLPLPAADGTSGQILGGSPDAPIKIEVFSDFQCPSCRELYLDVMRRALAEYANANKICVIYHEFPLAMHPYSKKAAQYAEAASRLGRAQLLKVYDVLFMDQAVWSQNGSIEASIAKVLSRDELQRIKKILQDPSINAAINSEIKLGNDRQVNSTPTFWVYTRGKSQKVEGRITYPLLKDHIDRNVK